MQYTIYIVLENVTNPNGGELFSVISIFSFHAPGRCEFSTDYESWSFVEALSVCLRYTEFCLVWQLNAKFRDVYLISLRPPGDQLDVARSAQVTLDVQVSDGGSVKSGVHLGTITVRQHLGLDESRKVQHGDKVGQHTYCHH